MARLLNIAIVGYGIAGIATAVHLRRLGHHIDHFERPDRDGSTGAGLLLHPPAISLLDELGLTTLSVGRGSPVTRFYAETVTGRRIMDFCYAARGTRSFGLGIQRRVLLAGLRGVDSGGNLLRRSHRVVSVDVDRGTLVLSNDSRHGPYDVIVAADGANSAVRRSVPSLVVHDRLYPSAALVCLIDDPRRLIGNCVAQRFDRTRHVSAWPVGNAGPATVHQASIAINVPLSQASAFRQSGEWRTVTARIWPSLAPLLSRQRVEDTAPLVYAYRDVVLRRYTIGRVVLVGDAAHSMSPQLGQGARLALEDASALALALGSSEDPVVALRKFDEMRRATVKRYQRASRWLTPIFQSDSHLLAALRDAASAPVTRIPVVARRLRTLMTAA